MPIAVTNTERNQSYAERVNAAMAEAGYSCFTMLSLDGKLYTSPHWVNVPRAVIWQALYLAKQGDPHPCWSCWSVAEATDPLGPDHAKGRWASDCVSGRNSGCHFPEGPGKPPRELLQQAQ